MEARAGGGACAAAGARPEARRDGCTLQLRSPPAALAPGQDELDEITGRSGWLGNGPWVGRLLTINNTHPTQAKFIPTLNAVKRRQKTPK